MKATPPSSSPSATADLNELLTKLNVEQKIANGAEHLLQLFDREPDQNHKDALKRQVEEELSAASKSIREIQVAIAEIHKAQPSTTDHGECDLVLL